MGKLVKVLIKSALILLLFMPSFLSAQENLKQIKNPGGKKTKKCRKYYDLYRKLPVEVRYTVRVVDGQILFYFPNEEMFREIFDKKFDGFAIDIISRDQFNCERGAETANSWAHKGELLPPIFRKDINKRMVIDRRNNVLINYGPLPEKYDPLNVECNLILLQKKFHCGYHSFSNIDYNQWELLEMGLYRDSLPDTPPAEFSLKEKIFFELAFEKNQHFFESSQMQPLYDSLHLSEYNVRSIDIKAFTSVEGDIENNVRLQNARASNIVEALQSYQKPEIAFSISASENWEDFFNDISKTQFQYLARYPQQKIKEELVKLEDSKEMNSILSAHRKVRIEIELERKVSKDHTSDEIMAFFGQAVKNGQIKDALYVQNMVFEQIKSNRLPVELLGRLEVPNLSEYSSLTNNETVFAYENGFGFIGDHIRTFEELHGILPKSHKVQYNLAALKLKASSKTTFGANRKQILHLIKGLSWKIEKELITRLKMNYHILNTDYLDQKGAYREKNKSLRQVYANYKKLKLSDEERLYLARFLAIYSQFNWAESLLVPRVFDANAAPELIDYYFRLTINDQRKINRPQYRELIESTLTSNKHIYCDLFLPTEQDGYSFQLLWNPMLADYYCESCENREDVFQIE